MNPSECIRTSNAITYGEKWSIFFIWLALAFAFAIVSLIVITVINWIIGDALNFLLMLGFFILYTAASMGVAATIYSKLAAKLDDPDFVATLV